MRKNIQIGIIMVLVLCTNITIFAQREQTRKVTATGSYVASTNETPAYGQAQALLEAKKQALREAGVMENISSTAIILMGHCADNDFHRSQDRWYRNGYLRYGRCLHPCVHLWYATR